MTHRVLVLPQQVQLDIPHKTPLLQALRDGGFLPDAPCGGKGTCGKCLVTVDGMAVRACGYLVKSDITVTLPQHRREQILTKGFSPEIAADPLQPGFPVALDIGTTTVVCVLMDPSGRELAVQSMDNPQRPWGADVISRIEHAVKGQRKALTDAIRSGVASLLHRCCLEAGIPLEEIGVISLVGNSCMQQLFLGMDVENLAAVPFSPAITQGEVVDAAAFFPGCTKAKLLIVPDMAGFVGSDTMGCVLAAGLHETEETVLLVDIGTNGELALTHRGRLVVCSTVAGPALEGGNISCGMRSAPGAIDHFDHQSCHVIGEGDATGICGSGLVDAVAAALEAGTINARGRILTPDHCLPLAPKVTLTQEDIRQVQMAKGAIAAGIRLLAEHMGIPLQEIQRVILAGAFGSYLQISSACRIGLLPGELESKIIAGGNLALSGAKLLARNKNLLSLTQHIAQGAEPLSLAQLPRFPRVFAQSMRFPE